MLRRVANIESSPVWDTSRINTAYQWSHKLVQPGRKFPKPVMMEYLAILYTDFRHTSSAVKTAIYCCLDFLSWLLLTADMSPCDYVPYTDCRNPNLLFHYFRGYVDKLNPTWCLIVAWLCSRPFLAEYLTNTSFRRKLGIILISSARSVFFCVIGIHNIWSCLSKKDNFKYKWNGLVFDIRLFCSLLIYFILAFVFMNCFRIALTYLIL